MVSKRSKMEVLVGGEGTHIVFRDDADLVGHELRRVETNTELTDHGNISPGAESLHELLRSRASDRSKVVDEIRLGHTDTGILDNEGLVRLVWDDGDFEVLLGVQDGRIR